MSGSHTPGPWHVKVNANGSLNLFAEDGHRVIMCDARLINQESNSRLIASAPDLLAALKSAVEALERADDSGLPGLHPIIAEASDAIDKAERTEAVNG